MLCKILDTSESESELIRSIHALCCTFSSVIMSKCNASLRHFSRRTGIHSCILYSLLSTLDNTYIYTAISLYVVIHTRQIRT